MHFRIKINYKDGKTGYSKILVVRKNCHTPVEVFPNPFVQNLNINFYKNTKVGSLRLISPNGLVLAQEQISNTNIRTYNWNIGKNLPPQNYFLQIFRQDNKLIKTVSISKN